MFPFFLRGEVRVPRELHGWPDARGAAASIAASLEAEGARDVRVWGESVAFRVPRLAALFRDAHLSPADGGVVVIREEGGALVMTYRLRLRRHLVLAGVTLAALATFGTLGIAGMRMDAASVAIFGVCWALGFLVLTSSMRHGFPRFLTAVVEREAARLPGSASHVAVPS